MSFSVGTSLGGYEIVGALGAGGMGEVYRARDAKLGREVAIKVLSTAFALDVGRVARFRREAQVLASLNHPHIAQIYGLEEVEGLQFLVMELVDGESLEKRIARGAIPIDEALPIAKQIAEALEAAHEKGIIHRDLKPANIALTKDGQVKVLDFGLAKAIEPADASVGSVDLANSPTLTSPALLSGVGMILGTAAYMSPEQAKGRPADKRSDIWAFGCVLFEMLTGKRAFEGEDASDTLAAVLRSEPAWSALPPTIPQPVTALIRAMLRRDRTERVGDVAVVRYTIAALADMTVEARTLPRHKVSGRWRVAVGLVAVATAITVAVGTRLPRPGTQEFTQPIQVVISPGSDATMTGPDNTAGIERGSVTASSRRIAISPNGAMVVFSAQTSPSQDSQLFVRRLNQLSAVPVNGTERATNPFFSPDGAWIGFFADNDLKKVPVGGGTVMRIGPAPGGAGGSWSDDDTIVFHENGTPETRILRVPAAGGDPVPITTVDSTAAVHKWPQLLPGNRLLYTVHHRRFFYWGTANIVVQTLPNGPRTIIVPHAYAGRYLRSGVLTYLRAAPEERQEIPTRLLAVGFDPVDASVRGTPVPVLNDIVGSNATGETQVATAAAGTAVYMRMSPERPGSVDAQISWIDRKGTARPLAATRFPWRSLRLSPDGRLALSMARPQRRAMAIWLYEPSRDVVTPLTTAVASAEGPVWSPDGRYVAFRASSDPTSTRTIYVQRSDGMGGPKRLTEGLNANVVSSWHPSGRFLAFFEVTPQANQIRILTINGWPDSLAPGAIIPLSTSTTVDERWPMFSPDGQWLAYVSEESGRAEIYVRSFPGPGPKVQISTSGGVWPAWSPAHSELLFATADGHVMKVSYRIADGAFVPSKPELWTPAVLAIRNEVPTFDIRQDGEAVAGALVQENADANRARELVLVTNLFEPLLEQRTSSGSK